MFTFSRCLKFWRGNVFLSNNILGFELLVLIFWCDRWVLAISCWFIWYINCVWGTFCVNSGEKPDDPHWICGKGHWPSSVCHLRDRASREGITDDTRAMEHTLRAWGSIVCVLALLSPQLRATTFGLWCGVVRCGVVWWGSCHCGGGKEWQHLWESEREKSRVTLTAERSSVWRLSDRLSVARPRKTSTCTFLTTHKSLNSLWRWGGNRDRIPFFPSILTWSDSLGIFLKKTPSFEFSNWSEVHNVSKIYPSTNISQ